MFSILPIFTSDSTRQDHKANSLHAASILTLFASTPTEAVFVKTPLNLDIYSSRTHAFFYFAQYIYASHIISLQLNVFHQIAKNIGDPKVPIIYLSHTKRCGSTLMCQLAEYSGETGAPDATGNCIALSQPDCLISVLDMLL